jgi:hypothetical protein
VASLSLIGALLLRPSPAPAGPEISPGIQDMRGGWAGFYQVFGRPATAPPHPVWLAIDLQFHRRFSGGLKVSSPQPSSVFLIEGLVTARGQTIFHGQSEDGRALAHVTRHDFGGGAAIFDGRLRLHHRDGAREDGRLLLLRRFIGNPDLEPPDVTGDYAGFATNEATGERKAVVIHWRAGLDQTDAPTKGAPTTEFVGDGFLLESPDTATEWAFQTLGTINSDGQIVASNQGPGGPLILTATLVCSPDPQQPARITGDYLLLLADGARDAGKFDVSFGAPPDPD